MASRLEGKKAVITGSTSNIGLAMATEFARQGAHVVISGRNGERGEAAASAIRDEGGRVEFVRADMDGSRQASLDFATEAARVLGGEVDVLVNNIGIYPTRSTLEATEDDFDQIFGANVKGPFFLTAALLPGMVERGSGSIINLGSWIARLGVPGSPLYSSSKGAMETMTKSWSAEFGPAGVRVNAISPGVVHEAPADPAEASPGDVMMKGTPAGTYGTPDSIAYAAVYLASDESKFVNGTVVDVDGGRTGVAVVAA